MYSRVGDNTTGSSLKSTRVSLQRSENVRARVLSRPSVRPRNMQNSGAGWCVEVPPPDAKFLGGSHPQAIISFFHRGSSLSRILLSRLSLHASTSRCWSKEQARALEEQEEKKPRRHSPPPSIGSIRSVADQAKQSCSSIIHGRGRRRESFRLLTRHHTKRNHRRDELLVLFLFHSI